MNTITMTYGAYSFSPVPLVSIDRQSVQEGNRNNPVAYLFKMVLNGTLVTTDPTGLQALDTLMQNLRSALNTSGKLLEIICDNGVTQTIVFQAYPKILSVRFDESTNNWTQTVPYTVELEYSTDEYDEHPSSLETPPYIESFNEEWNCEFIQDNKTYEWDLSGVTDQKAGFDYSNADGNNKFEIKVTHNVTVKGRDTWADSGGNWGAGIDKTGTFSSAADNAMQWATGVFGGFGYDSAWGHAITGWLNLTSNTADYIPVDHFRTHTVNETDGEVNLVESWVILGANSGIPNGARKYSENFVANIRKSTDTPNVVVSVQGEVKGFEDRTYVGTNLTTNTTTSAYQNAESGWIQVKDRLYPRSQFVYQKDYSGPLNPLPLSNVVGYNPGKGLITYNYEYDNRPCAFITGAISENFSINDTNPSDVFASLTVLGRPYGPVLQSISTVTEYRRAVSIEAVMPLPTGCTSITDLDLNKPTENVKNLLCSFETQLTSAYPQVFKASDNESWNPLNGRYTRSVEWVYTNCTGNAPNTSMC